MNPSIHFDGTLWRCALRCSDYAMPGGVTIKSHKARRDETRTKSAMVIFDPGTWRAVEIYKMHEQDEMPRAPCASLGYEDIRLFRTDKDGLQGIAASLHLRRDDPTSTRGPRKPLAEQVLLSFSAEYDIVEARPIRGDRWSDTPQKNWVPFDHCTEPRFLYSISRGTLFNERGSLRAAETLVKPASRRRSRSFLPDAYTQERAKERASTSEHARARAEQERPPQDEFYWELTQVSEHDELRGGTQLVRVNDGAWLGLGHAMRLVENRKYYWHVWYLVDARGALKATSPPMKLAANGIEFAAGMAIDGDRVVVSFGVDDMECRIGETSLSAVMKVLQPISGP